MFASVRANRTARLDVPEVGRPAQDRLRATASRTSSDRAAGRDHGDEGAAWVTPGDIYANRAVAIPEPVHAGLVDATDTLVQTASNAMSAAACLDRVTQDRPSGSGPEPAPPRSRPRDGPTPVAQDVPRAPLP
jgi:hypothetical protein